MLPSFMEIEAEELRRSFYAFVREGWQVVEPETPYVDGWHIHAICDYLQALADGHIPSNNLLVNVPPRHMKSLLVNVFFPAWIWARKPWTKFLFFSWSEDLTIRDSLKSRRLVGSDWYQWRFHVQIDPRNDTKEQFGTLDGGYRNSFGTRGSIAGQGGDYLVIDDPLEISKANSKAERDQVNYTYDNAISNRGNDPKTVRKILIMQRLHEEDLAGHILASGDEWEQLILPAEYEGVERFRSSLGFRDPRTEVGELLWPQRYGPDEIAEIKHIMSEMMVAGQLQQRPAPLLGAIFKQDWFQERRDSQSVVGRYWSWDTAGSMSENAAYTCGIVGELTADFHLFIREVWRDRVEFPQLQYQIDSMVTKYGAPKFRQHIIIENKSSGISVIQSLRQTSAYAEHVAPFNPQGDKLTRAYEAAKWAEKGMVILPAPNDKVPWLKDFEDELFSFPNSAHADQVDALSQLVLFLSSYLEQGLAAKGPHRRIR